MQVFLAPLFGFRGRITKERGIRKMGRMDCPNRLYLLKMPLRFSPHCHMLLFHELPHKAYTMAPLTKEAIRHDETFLWNAPPLKVQGYSCTSVRPILRQDTR